MTFTHVPLPGGPGNPGDLERIAEQAVREASLSLIRPTDQGHPFHLVKVRVVLNQGTASVRCCLNMHYGTTVADVVQQIGKQIEYSLSRVAGIRRVLVTVDVRDVFFDPLDGVQPGE